MVRQPQPSHWTEAPTVALRLPSGPAALQPRRQMASTVAVIGAITVGVIFAFLVISNLVGSATPDPAPPAVPAPTSTAPLSLDQRTDANLDGIYAGLDLRRAYGDYLTGQTVSQSCGAEASMVYPTSPEAAHVFTSACTNVAVRGE